MGLRQVKTMRSSRFHHHKRSIKEFGIRLTRVGRKKGKRKGSTQFFDSFGEIQEQAQQRTIELERKLQEEAIAFHLKTNQDQARFEEEMARLRQGKQLVLTSKCSSRTTRFKWTCYSTKLFEKQYHVSHNLTLLFIHCMNHLQNQVNQHLHMWRCLAHRRIPTQWLQWNAYSN